MNNNENYISEPKFCNNYPVPKGEYYTNHIHDLYKKANMCNIVGVKQVERI